MTDTRKRLLRISAGTLYFCAMLCAYGYAFLIAWAANALEGKTVAGYERVLFVFLAVAVALHAIGFLNLLGTDQRRSLKWWEWSLYCLGLYMLAFWITMNIDVPRVP